MERILIIGSGGAGKSTLSKKLHQKLGLPLIQLDCYFWNPGWIQTPSDEWRKMVEKFVAQDRWIMDGNYSSTLDIRLQRADTVIFMDFPRMVCLRRVIKRWIQWRGKSRPDIAEGCPEGIDWEFVKWIWTFPKRRRAEILQKIQPGYGKKVFILKKDNDVNNFLDEFENIDMVKS